jgi:hypothetical protein
MEMRKSAPCCVIRPGCGERGAGLTHDRRIASMRASHLLACFALATATILAGCGGKPDPIWSQLAGYKCGGEDGAPSTICATRPPGEGAAEVSRHCYATIADANCLDRPDPERKNQELGSSGY